MKKCANKKRLIASSSLLIFSVIFALSGAFVNRNAHAYTATNENIIENIYIGGGKFDKGNLDKLAAKVGYNSGVGDLVTAATDFNYTTDNIGFKNSADFGDTVVKFGTYTYKNTEYELSWLPTFISKADNNDVILTLWLAGTSGSNDVSMQEVSSFAANTVTTDSNGFVTATGGYNTNIATSPSSNDYSRSYIRAVTLNNGGFYTKGYNSTDTQQTLTSIEYAKTSNGTNKFEAFTTGGIKDYLVTPENVSWQKDANYLKNDPAWKGNSYGNYTQSVWLSDKLWLPSVYEVYDSTKGSNSNASDFDEIGGLWQTGEGYAARQKRSNTVMTWLRSGSPGSYSGVRNLNDIGSCSYDSVDYTGAVRPALHLNLTKAAANSFNTIENIYDQANNKFNTANLNALAKAAEFSDLNSMIKFAKNGDKKTSQDFGDTLVNFGSYTFGGVSRELTWIPTYVSQDDKGNAILTLWLAGTDSANGMVSNQELSTFTGGGYNNDAGMDPSSNNYDTSKIRTEMLNNAGSYYNFTSTSGTTGKTPTPYTPTSDGTNKYEIFTTGALNDYIVTPENVSWQTGTGTNRLKNDKGWSGSGNYTTTWTADKLWLPSVYEVYDSGIEANNNVTEFTENGGLWKTGNGEGNRQRRSNSTWSWLRSGLPDNYYREFCLNDTGNDSTSNVIYPGAVRPALHLNLNMAATSACGDAHTWNDGTVTKEATCTETGTKFFTCTTCGETKTEPIEKLAHTWDTTAWLNDDTNHWHKCANCTEITDKAEHTPSEWITDTPATCTQEGTQHKECTTCKKILETGTIPLAEHSWNEGEQTTDPTCTKEGVKTFTCTVCGETKTEAVPVIPHTPEEIAAVAPTCDKTGLTAGSICSVCKTVITEQKVVPALGHDWGEGTVTKEATCTQEGVKTFICTVCGETKTEAIPVIAHTPSDWIIDTPATCTEAGARHKICTVCNQTLESETVPAKGHSWSAWTITKPATKDEQGEKQRTCSACQKTETQIIAKLVEDEGGNGSVGDLPELPDPDSNYKLEITIKATDKVYALDGQSKGYNVRLWIVNNKTDDKKEFSNQMEVNLSLIVPHGMEQFTLYQLEDGEFKEIPASDYTVESGVLTIHTKLPREFIFNTAAAPAKGGIPWWVWLIVGLAVVAVVIIIVIVVVKKKHAPAPETETVYVNGESYDDTELKRKVEEQNEKIDELLNREIPVDALSQTLTDDEMRSFFTDQELNDMVKQGKITQQDCDRVIRGRKK